jgi:hypothetical protein
MQEVKKIGQKFQNSSELLAGITASLHGVTCSSDCDAADSEVWPAMPETTQRLMSLCENWYKHWKEQLTDKGTELGTVTSYVGSVFKPEEIPVAQILLCVLGDMEMMLNEAQVISLSVKTSKQLDKNNSKEIINKIACIVATFQFIDQSPAKEKLNQIQFPCSELKNSLEKIIEGFPNFYQRMEAIGM